MKKKGKSSLKTFLAFAFIGLFMVSMFSGVVSAQTSGDGLTWGYFEEKVNIGLEFLFRGGENFDDIGARFLFFVLIALLVYSIANSMPFLKDQELYITFPVSLIIAYISTAYIAPAELYAMLMAYTAMGVVLGAIFPFIVLAVFTYEMAKEDTPGMLLFSKLMWIGFLLLVIYRFGAGLFEGKMTAGIAIVYGLVSIIGLVAIFGQDRLVRWLGEERLKSVERKMAQTAELSTKDDVIKAINAFKKGGGDLPPYLKKAAEEFNIDY